METLVPKRVKTVLGFGALVVLLGHFSFNIPGSTLKSNCAELAILMAIPFVSGWLDILLVASFAFFNVAPDGFRLAEAINHLPAALFAWWFFQRDGKSGHKTAFVLKWFAAVLVYYLVFLIPVYEMTLVFQGRQSVAQAVLSNIHLVPRLYVEMLVTAAIASLYFLSVHDYRELARTQDHLGKLSTVIEQNPLSVLIYSPAGVVDYVSPGFLAASGYTAGEVLGRSMGRGSRAEDPAGLPEEAWNAVQGGSSWRGELRSRNREGEAYWEMASLNPILDGQGVLRWAVALKVEVTGMVKLREQLQQSQNREIIGTLAGGIAHDFNNILSVIFGYADLARVRAEGQTPILEALDSVTLASERARDLVAQILTISRKRDTRKVPVEVELLVREVAKLLRSSIPTTIDITVEGGSRARVEADPGLIHQILMNLGTNAAYAMKGQPGQLTFALQEWSPSGEDPVLGLKLPPGQYLMVKVKDTGTGIPPELLDRIFDPYFTTKPVGEGTGLGLSVVSGAVEAMGGTLRVHSEVGQGTTFQFVLPRLPDETLPAPAVQARAVEERGRERILFVDDEAAITSLAQESLPGFGYQVECFLDAQAALERFQAEPGAFDLIVTDLTMPKLTGIRLAEEVQRLRPGMPILLCTGYSDAVERERALAIGISDYLEKPITMGALHEKVRAVMARALSGL